MDRRTVFRMMAGAAVAPAAVVAVVSYSHSAPAGFHRVSVEKDDPGYIPYCKLRGDKNIPEIYFNGEKQEGVHTADAKEGFVKRCVLSDKGNRAHNGRDWIYETVFGHVEIRLPVAV